jgi:glyoxylase-like metal-dependent hydrolase (beta-lactamase superfamily II)
MGGDLCSGDALLPDTIPTPGLQFPGVAGGDLDAPRWPSLPPMLASVEAIAALRPARILPGHGEIVDDPARLIDRFRGHHQRRAGQVRDALASGATCAHDIARALFPRLDGVRVAQAMTEVIGHLDVLEAAGSLRCDGDGDGIRRYVLS